jgi:hypothetical protein
MTADGWYTLTGRGQVATFGRNRLPDGVQNPRELIGQQVSVDGVLYTVKALEHWAIVCEGECGHPFGLLLT